MAEIMDVSRHQGTIDWAKVKASGKIGGVMIRAMGNSAEGLPSKPYTDPQFAHNYAALEKLGIPCGVYGYFKAVDREQADKELAYFKKLLTGRSFELPVAVDIEDEVQKPLGKAALTDLTAQMLSTVESWGVYAHAVHRFVVRQYLPLHGRCKAEALRRVAGRLPHEEARARLAVRHVAVHQHCPRARCEHQC